MSTSPNFQKLSDACRQRGYCLELHDDGKTRKIKDGIEYRVINALRISYKRTHAQVPNMYFSCSPDTLDQVAATAMQRLR